MEVGKDFGDCDLCQAGYPPFGEEPCCQSKFSEALKLDGGRQPEPVLELRRKLPHLRFELRAEWVGFADQRSWKHILSVTQGYGQHLATTVEQSADWTLTETATEVTLIATRPELGVKFSSHRKGEKVDDVPPESYGAAIGLKVGDVVTYVNSFQVKFYKGVVKTIIITENNAKVSEDSPMTLRVLRRGSNVLGNEATEQTTLSAIATVVGKNTPDVSDIS
jgi:hypothetical protein